MFADWVIMGVVVTDVYFKAGTPNSFARIRLATSGPRGRFFVTAWAYGKTAETARDLLRGGTSATLRGYFNPDSSQGATGKDALSLIVSHIDVPRASDHVPDVLPSERSNHQTGAVADRPNLVAAVPPEYTPGEAAKTVEKLTRTAQDDRKQEGDTQAGGKECPLRKAPCRASCEIRQTCESVAKQQGIS